MREWRRHFDDSLADWTVFSQAGEPSFGYKGHRSGGGHLLAGDTFANYLKPDATGARFVYTSMVHLPTMNHLLRAAYCGSEGWAFIQLLFLSSCNR